MNIVKEIWMMFMILKKNSDSKFSFSLIMFFSFLSTTTNWIFNFYLVSDLLTNKQTKSNKFYVILIAYKVEISASGGLTLRNCSTIEFSNQKNLHLIEPTNKVSYKATCTTQNICIFKLQYVRHFLKVIFWICKVISLSIFGMTESL